METLTLAEPACCHRRTSRTSPVKPGLSESVSLSVEAHGPSLALRRSRAGAFSLRWRVRVVSGWSADVKKRSTIWTERHAGEQVCGSARGALEGGFAWLALGTAASACGRSCIGVGLASK